VIEDLLDVAQLTAGKIVLHRTAVDLLAMAVRSVTSLHKAGRTESHRISVAGYPVTVEADAARLEQIIENLVENAIRHTAPGGRIDVMVERAAEGAVVRVRDTGEGIPPEVLPRVFDLFFQAPQSLDRARGGLGIGLSLVQRLVGLHGGTVSVQSAGPGQGSEFVVHLPLPLGGARTPESAQRALPTATARHVVLIEDNPDFRDALRDLLEMWGHRVEEAADGKRGLERVVASRPEIALIDLGLPGLDGYNVAKAIRAAAGGDRIRLIAVTGYGQPADRDRARDAGFDAYVVKPVDEEELLRLLENVGVAPSVALPG
jgi:two-component system, sensor histidine kinase